MLNSGRLSLEEQRALAEVGQRGLTSETSARGLFPFVGGEDSSNLLVHAKVCQSYARALFEERLSARLKKTVRVASAGLEAARYSDFVERVDSPSSLCAYLIGEGHRAVLELNQSLAFAIVDLLMGGKGYPPVETRPLSELEQNFLQGIMESLVPDIERAWNQIIPHRWTIVQEAQFTYTLDGFLPDEKTFLVEFEVGIEDLVQGRILMGVPVAAMVAPGEKRAAALGIEDPLRSPLAAILPIRLQVVLPSAELTVERLLEIQEGDTLELSGWELPTDESGALEVLVCVERHPRYVGRLGVINNKKAVEILRTVEDIEVE